MKTMPALSISLRKSIYVVILNLIQSHCSNLYTAKFNLHDINFVEIEHRAAILGGTDIDVERNGNNLLEYWEGGNWLDGHYDGADDTMDKRWSNVNEDRLKICCTCTQMTLLLRFMADLKDAEDKSKATRDESGLMDDVGTETKLWCRTIARCVVFLVFLEAFN